MSRFDLSIEPRRHEGAAQNFSIARGRSREHVCTGNVAMTRSDLPGIGRRDGIWYALGCNGSGVALMPYLGHRVALKILGQREGKTAYDDIPFTAVPFYNGTAWFRPLMSWWFRARDKLRGH